MRGGEGFLGETLFSVGGRVRVIEGDVETLQVGLGSIFGGVLADTDARETWPVVVFTGFCKLASSFATLAGRST